MITINENRPGYKQTKMGWIPEEWKVPALNSVCKINQGLQIAISMRLKKHVNDSQVYITIQYLNGKSEPEYIMNPSKSVCCDEDDILMTRTGNTGIVVSNVKGVFHNNFFKINYDSVKILKMYFIYFLRQSKTQHLILSLAGSSTIPDLNHKDFYSIRIPLPMLPEQKKIAEILSTWDQAIEKLEKLIELKEQRKKGLMQQLLTGKKRLPGFGKLVKNNREVPEGWRKIKLSNISKDITRRNLNGNKHVLTASGKHGLVDQKEYFNRNVSGADLSKYYLLYRGEFAYNRSSMNGYSFGAIKRLDRYETGILSTLYMCFKIDENQINSDFILEYFESGLCNFDLNGRVQVGARAHGLLNITKSDFFSISLIVPSLGEQKRISKVIQVVNKDILANRKILNNYHEQKRGLMQKLLTGEVRVKLSEGNR